MIRPFTNQQWIKIWERLPNQKQEDLIDKDGNFRQREIRGPHRRLAYKETIHRATN